MNNINGQGLPEEVVVNSASGQVKLDATYHSNGTPLAVTATPAGGEETKTEYDEHGALVMLQRPMEDPIVYNRNQWGTVESMDYAGANYPIFGSRNDLNWSLSNGVNLALNDWGQLITVAKQGLAAKTITYDGQGRLKDIKIGETVETVVTYDGAVVDTVDHAGVTETYNRDETGRVTSVTVNDTMVAKAGDTNGTWTYKDDGSGRVATYLDRNGALQRYNYDKAGRLTEIAIEHGPTLRYAYNKYGQLATVQSGDLRADFSNYDKGVPGTITWGDPDAAVQTFTVTKNLEGRIDRIESSDGAFLLDLDWTQATDGSGSWLIDRVEKQADGFGEVWAPTYSADKRLDAITITRSTGQVIAETYNVDANRLLGGLTRVVDGVTVLDATNTSDAAAANIRNQVLADATSGINWTGTYSSDKGNLTQLADGLGNQMDLTYDARRRISSVTHAVPGGNLTYDYLYDLENRRLRAEVPVDNSGTWTTTERVYAFQGSRVIAIGDMDASSTITWTHAIGWGPLGPVFIDDLTSAGNDYYLFTDHLGTPFGHHNPATDTTYHTPTNPWGELLATHPAPAPHYTAQGAVATSGAGGPAFTLPPDATHATSPLGLAGHLYDHHTGLVYMHNRHYHPRLGHFTTPDYRAPDIYDPTTYTEPYAYAGGNPIMFWDPNGLIWTESSDRRFAKKQQRRMNGEYDTQLDKFFEVVLGVFGGTVRNTTLGGKDFVLLLYSYGESKRRIRTSQVREWFGLSALQGVEDDIAYVNLVNDSLQDLFVNEGIFQSMGQGAADSLNRALSELEKGNYFETGVEGAEFVEVVTMLSALPKAGLSTAKQLRIVGNGEDLLAISDDLLDAHIEESLKPYLIHNTLTIPEKMSGQNNKKLGYLMPPKHVNKENVREALRESRRARLSSKFKLHIHSKSTIVRITGSELPKEEFDSVKRTLQLVFDKKTPKNGDPLRKKWGTKFKNWGKDLPGPTGASSPFREYRVLPAPGIRNAGPRRIVVDMSNGKVYYTWTHYGDAGDPAFVLLTTNPTR